MGNKNLHKAKIAKNNEFYTQLPDIEKELWNYKEHFKDKVIFCNCDDPEESNFWFYFAQNFEFFGLKKLISTHFESDEPSYKLEIVRDANGDGKIDILDTIKTPLKQNGDFRSPECVELLKASDIVVSNPPFSLFREYVAQLIEYDKRFIILGNQNAITYKAIFKLMMNNEMWLGYNTNKVMSFNVPDSYTSIGGSVKVPAISWFTNIETKRRHEDIILYKTYNPDGYPKYDNYDAINVNKVKDIPKDYDGYMGVPITFMNKYNPDQFKIIALAIGEDNFTPTKKYGKFRDAETRLPSSDKRDYLLYIRDECGKYLTTENYRVTKLYARIIICNRKVGEI